MGALAPIFTTTSVLADEMSNTRIGEEVKQEINETRNYDRVRGEQVQIANQLENRERYKERKRIITYSREAG